MRQFLIITLPILVAGCSQVTEFLAPERAEEASDKSSIEVNEDTVSVDNNGATPVPSAAARTPEQFDTTSKKQRADAVTKANSGQARSLGRTVASLGAAGEPGIWLKTSLVDRASKGRVDYPSKGTRVAVDLLPLENNSGGAQLSLAAMRLLQADLTSLPEIEVFTFD